PDMLPSTTSPEAWELPKLDPVIVIIVPEVPEAGFTLDICGTPVLKESVLLHTPFWRICAFPDNDPGATVATTWLSFQLTTEPYAVPSQTCPELCAEPK